MVYAPPTSSLRIFVPLPRWTNIESHFNYLLSNKPVSKSNAGAFPLSDREVIHQCALPKN